MKNFCPKLNINTSFVDITNLKQVEKSITKKTKAIYCESVSNPLLEVANIKLLSKIAKKNNIVLIVDNTFYHYQYHQKNLGQMLLFIA